MKNKLMLLLSFFILIMNNPNKLFSQCTNQVTHVSGTASISGVNVSVTSSGLVDTFTTYCGNTLPYFIGYDWSLAGGNGSYSFTFSPPVSSLTLNFSGISYTTSFPTVWEQELIRIFINGSHYAIPSIGTINNCDTMAVLTPSGDITGCYHCGVSGWNGTTITDTISSLTILDTMIMGTDGAGSLFSLFICDPVVNAVTDPKINLASYFYPNPFKDQLTLILSNNEQMTVTLFDIFSRPVLQKTFINSITLETEQFEHGVYYFELYKDNKILRNGKVIKY